jgi:photosystem II stability/assembly factor-like uncharacterized protein/tetratricopeptide (TPR) repeat protein
MRSFLAALLASALLPLAARAADLRNFEDATLRAVQFVDGHEGWAVGDEGVIWHTIDAGATWERQATGVRASLRSVHFLNPFTGWVVGREELPHGTGSVGVLLFTRDGGLKWQRVHANRLPGLNRVRFVDNTTGFVLGDGSDQYPSGLFRTINSGRTWQPVAGPRWPAWLAGDFQDAQTGALAGAWGRLAALRQDKLFAAEVDAIGGRMVNDVQVIGKRAVAVGQGGLILLSRDSAGATWGYATPNLPAEVLSSWDFDAVHCVGDAIWIAGRPGSALLHSKDQGASWQVLPTGWSAPLHGIHFADARHGWAVGELGTILSTGDGGQTWKVQHEGGRRAAILFIHSRATSLPVDTVALQGGEEGYLVAGLRVFASDPLSAAPSRASEGQRFAAAVRQAGGAAGEILWQFPVPQHLSRASKSELVQSWNALHTDRATEEILRQLVLAIRTWRPSVIVTDHPEESTAALPGEALLCEALHEAFAQAADPAAFPEQIKRLGLEAWKVDKIYGLWEERAGAQITVDPTAICTRLESSANDFATSAAVHLADAPFSLPLQRFYKLLDSRIAGAASHRDLMDGIDLARGGLARRKQLPLAELAPEREKALRLRRNLQAMAEAPASDLTDPNRLLSQIGPMLSHLPDDQGAPAAYAVADRYARLGQWTMAREMFLYMVDRYPAHPRTADAYRWLIRHNASSEARRRHELGQFWALTDMTFKQTKMPEHVDPHSPRKVNPEMNLERDEQMVLLSDRKEARQWYQGSLEIGNRLAALGPVYANDPAIQFCLQAARRHLGEFDKAQSWYAQFASEHADGPWREAAAAELWLTNRSGPPPKPIAVCRQTATRPFLDGELDDPCWQGVKPLPMRNAVGDTLKEYPTEVRLAFDKDFLYLALRCKHPPEKYVAPVKVRPHDADLRPYDRVSLLLDLDRDYSTYFNLEVDQRGCVCDDCWGDRSWNPRWFVAVKSEKDCWQIEAAIPLTELSSESVGIGRTWACNVVRTLPGRGVQAWSVPADVQPRPEGMGLLMFMQDLQNGAPAPKASPKPLAKAQ